MVEIRERDFESFFQAPFNAYGRDSHFVSPFKPDLKRFLDNCQNPLFTRFGDGTYFTAHRDGKAVGRITAHLHRASNERHGWNRSYFGAVDAEAAGALLRASEAWGRAQGCEEIHGNFNLTAMQQIGVMTGGFEHPPYSDLVYNPPHIPELLASNGYEPYFPMTTFEIDLKALDLSKLRTPAYEALRRDPDFEWTTIKKKLFFKKQMAEACEALNDGFDQNPMFVPLTIEEFHFQAKDLMLVIDERISSAVYYKGKIAGMFICIPDLNPLLRGSGSKLGLSTPYHFLKHRLTRKRAVVIFQSVKREWHNRGLGASIIYETMKSLKEAGYETMGATWISDDNKPSLRGVERCDGKPLHRLHLFKKSLQEKSA